MTQRESCLLWLYDLLEHLREMRQRLEETERPEAARMLVENMLRDLASAHRLCETLQARFAPGAVA
jgi:hypothetical protein